MIVSDVTLPIIEERAIEKMSVVTEGSVRTPSPSQLVEHYDCTNLDLNL